MNVMQSYSSVQDRSLAPFNPVNLRDFRSARSFPPPLVAHLISSHVNVRLALMNRFRVSEYLEYIGPL